MRTAKLLFLTALLAFASQPGKAAPPSPDALAGAVVRLTSHGGSATVIQTRPGKSLLLSCGHCFQGKDRTKPIVLDAPRENAGQPKHVGVRLLATDYDADLSLIELSDGPLPYVAPVAPAGHQPNYRLLSVGYDSMRWPATQVVTRVWNTQGTTTFTLERPWHGRSGGALIDLDAGYLIGVVSGYEVQGQRRGIYVSLKAIQVFLARSRGGSVNGPASTPLHLHREPWPGIGVYPQGSISPFGRDPLSAPAPFCPPGKS